MNDQIERTLHEVFGAAGKGNQLKLFLTCSDREMQQFIADGVGRAYARCLPRCTAASVSRMLMHLRRDLEVTVR